MLELGIAALVIALAVRLFASLARFAFRVLLLVGLLLVVLGLLGFELPALLPLLGSLLPR